MRSVFKKITFILFFIGLWIVIDHFTNRISIIGFVTPWYPQIAMSVVLLLVSGLQWVWLVFLAKIISSVVVWPGNIAERILPNVVFALGVFVICYLIKRFRAKPQFTWLMILKVILYQAMVLFVVAVFRSYFYVSDVTKVMTLVSGILHNWMADFTSILCLTPGLSILFDPLRREIRNTGLQYLKKFWYLPALIVLLEVCVLLMPEHLHERLWYISFLPCFAFALISGLEGTILLCFFTNVFLASIAITTFSSQGAIEMQVFFISMNMLLFFLGFVTSDRRRRMTNLINSNREYIYSQFNKVNALILMQTEISQYLKVILKELENHTNTESVARTAKDFLEKLNLFFANLEMKKNPPRELKYFQTIYLKQKIRDIMVATLPAEFLIPEIEISKKIPIQIEMDVDFLDLVVKQMVNLIYQINPKSKIPACLLVDWEEHELRIRAKIFGPMKSVQASQISFMSAYWTFQKSLPSGGFALTSYILHALAARSGGEFWLQPLWFSPEDVLVAEFLIPLGKKKNAPKDFHG